MPSSGKLDGQPVNYYLEEMERGGPLKKTLGIAVLNALWLLAGARSSPERIRLTNRRDPLDNAVIPDDAYVVIVGALVPYLRDA